mgnify:CR=1 FL=1
MAISVFNMMNHRNGQFKNVDQLSSVHHGEDVSVIAIRDIAEGEMIYYSYNEYDDEACKDIEYIWVTPQIFADYGFVEQYPRRFYFKTYGDNNKLTIEINEDDNGVRKVTRIDNVEKDDGPFLDF